MPFIRTAFAALVGFALVAGLVLPEPAHAVTRTSQAKTKAVKPVAGRTAKPVASTARRSSTSSVRGKVSAGKTVAFKPRRAVVVAAPQHPSFGQLSGLHETDDPLELKSSVAYVMDTETNEILLNKNSQAVLPIASITKLMTALIVTQAGQSLDDVLTISDEDVDTEKGSRSRLQVGTSLTRGEMLHLALMSSENRAAHALGRNYPGGLGTFVAAMNAKAQLLGMRDTRYVEPTGLSSSNQSSARDLAMLVQAAHAVPLIRELSTSPEHQVAVGSRLLQYRTTNRLVLNPSWDIGVQKTGYITEAGQCLVMQAKLAGRQLVMVLLDSAGRYSRVGDAERIRKWLSEQIATPAAQGAIPVSVSPAAAGAVVPRS